MSYREILGAVRKQVVRLIQPAWPVLLWLYVFLASYVVIGTFTFPDWWKRLLFGGLFDNQVWVEAIDYLATMVKLGYPLGLTIVVGIAAIVGLCMFKGVKNAFDDLRPPSRLTLGSVSLVLVTAIVGLRQVRSEYRTADDLNRDLDRLIETNKEQGDRFLKELQPFPPDSGYFMYLDADRIGRAFNTLQQDMKTALQTTTKQIGGEIKGTVSLKGVGAEAVSREMVETSEQRTPREATPERQAVWLINTYKDLRLGLDLPYGLDSVSWEVRLALSTFEERGVKVTPDQRTALLAGDIELAAKKLSRPNAPVLRAGKVQLLSDGNQFTVRFKNANGPMVTVSGTGPLTALDNSIHSCTRQPKGCEINARLLGIVWKTAQTSNEIILDMIPLAIW